MLNGADMVSLAGRFDRAIGVARDYLEGHGLGLLYSVFLSLMVEVLQKRLEERNAIIADYDVVEAKVTKAKPKKETVH